MKMPSWMVKIAVWMLVAGILGLANVGWCWLYPDQPTASDMVYFLMKPGGTAMFAAMVASTGSPHHGGKHRDVWIVVGLCAFAIPGLSGIFIRQGFVEPVPMKLIASALIAIVTATLIARRIV